MTTITLDKYYGLTILSAVGLGVQCFLTPLFTVTPLRKKLFNQEFMQKEFGEIHKKELGTEPSFGGFPDQGFGRYSDKLSYKDWYQFACAQRTHGQFVEQIGIVIPLILVSGLSNGKIAAILGGVNFIGRILYTIGYTSKKGADARKYGGLVLFVSMLGLIATSFKTCWDLVKPLLKK